RIILGFIVMLDPLLRVPGVNSGVGVVTSSGSSSDLFLQLHYCSTFLKAKKRVVIISSNLAESNYRVIFSKVAIRWDPSLISFLDLDNLLGGRLHIDEGGTITRLIEALDHCIKPDLIVFDDVSALERLNMQASAVVYLLYELYNRLEPSGLLLALFGLKTKAFSMMVSKADFVIGLTPVGSGFGKDVTGQMIVNVRGATSTPDNFELLYFTGERSIKGFYPGGISFLNL
uniref:Elongator complex protein 6 n=1 Tax=Haemonchus contortus TaxID=6289 RepID=A0A7I4XWJ9_HAECO